MFKSLVKNLVSKSKYSFEIIVNPRPIIRSVYFLSNSNPNDLHTLPAATSLTQSLQDKIEDAQAAPLKTRPKKPRRNPDRRQDHDAVKLSSRSCSVTQSDDAKESKDSDSDAKTRRKLRRQRQTGTEGRFFLAAD